MSVGGSIQTTGLFAVLSTTEAPSVKNIKITFPCNKYPLTSLFLYVYSKRGVYLFFLFLLKNIDCAFSLEALGRVGSDVC